MKISYAFLLKKIHEFPQVTTIRRKSIRRTTTFDLQHREIFVH
jgi:hypothetical protein